MKQKQSFGFFITVAIILQLTQAVRNIYTPSACRSCLADPTKYAGICQSKYSESISYCCTPDEMNNHRACYESPMCSQRIASTDMQPIMCPHDRRVCGNTYSPIIKLGVGQTQRVRISKTDIYNENDVCSFIITTDQQVEARNMDLKNRKYLNIWFDYFENLNVFVSNATSAQEIQYRSQVTYTNRNFTQPNTQQYYVVVQPAAGTEWGSYILDFTASFWKYDPGCPEFTSFDGYKCVANYTLYCQSLVPLFRQQTGDPNTTVSYNGTACVVDAPGQAGSGTGDKEGKVIDKGGKIPVIEVIAKRTVDDELRKAGTDQIAHTLTMVVIIIGIFIYIIQDFRQSQDEEANAKPYYDMIQPDSQFKNPTIEPHEDYDDEIEDETPGAVSKKGKQVDIDNLDGDDGQSGASIQNTNNQSDINNSVSMLSASARSENEPNDVDGYQALTHHLHFETVGLPPIKQKRRFTLNSASNVLGFGKKSRKSMRLQELSIPTQNSEASIDDHEKQKLAIQMQEQYNKKHGTILNDDKERVKEGAIDETTTKLIADADGAQPIDFHSNYKYLPKDGANRKSLNVAAAASHIPDPSIAEEKEDDEIEVVEDITPAQRRKDRLKAIEEKQLLPDQSPTQIEQAKAAGSTLSLDSKKAPGAIQSSSDQPGSDADEQRPLYDANANVDIESDKSSQKDPTEPQLSPRAAARAEIQRQMELNKERLGSYMVKTMKKSKEAELLDRIRSLKQEWAEDEDKGDDDK